MNCKKCGSETGNPKFCSRSCAAAYNNELKPKRALEGSCVDCGRSLSSSLKRCSICRRKRKVEASEPRPLYDLPDSLALFYAIQAKNKPSKSQKGDTAQLILLSKLSEAGVTVLDPLCEGLPFDIVVCHGGHFFRLQVKRARRKPLGTFHIPFRQVRPPRNGKASHHRYTSSEVDFMVGVVVESGDCYVFPMDVIEGHASGVNIDPFQVSQGAARGFDPEVYRNKVVTPKGEIPLFSFCGSQVSRTPPP